MKRIKNLLVMCGVFVILAAALIIIRNISKKDTDASDTGIPLSTSYTAAKVDTSTVYSIKYNLGDEKYSFSLNDSGTAWRWDENPELPLDNTYFASMASALKLVTSTVKLTGEQSALATYGLDSPWLTVSVSDEANGSQTFMFGNLNSYNKQYYFMNGSEPGTVYMVSGSVASPFDLSPYDMVANDTLPSIDSASVRKLTFKSSADVWVYTYYENGKDSTPDTEDFWYVSKNGGTETAVEAETGAGISQAIASISFLKIAGYSMEDKKALGLDLPTVLTVSYTSETAVTNDSGASTTVSVESTLVLNLGYADGKGNVYASLPDSVLSYYIDGSVIAGLYNAIISPSDK